MINSFHGEYSFLSNFHRCFCWYDNLYYPTVEHAYQSAKSLDLTQRHLFTNSDLTSGQAKRLGRKTKLRQDWEQIKLDVMEEIVSFKFNNNPILKQHLLKTRNEELIEGNNWGDTYWGVCKGVGENHLGKILMKVRKELNN